MSDTFDPTAGDVGASSEATPLDAILDSRDAAAEHTSGVESPLFDTSDGSLVPLEALKGERARRKKVDARVKELEDELQRFNDQRWGFDEDEFNASSQQQANGAGQDHYDEKEQNYARCLTDFTSRHGAAGVAAVDAALRRLTPEQKQEVVSFVGTEANPVEKVYAYVKQLGLLDAGFKPQSIADVLASKGKEQAANGSEQFDQRLTELSQREQSLNIAERRAIEAASKSEFATVFSRDDLNSLDSVVGQLIQTNHPAVAQLQAVYQSSPHPVLAVAELLHQWGGWAPSETQPAAQPHQRHVMPSNFVGARNVGMRSGPVWSGPTPIKDIFARGAQRSA